MWKLEVIRDGEIVCTEWGYEDLRWTLAYYARVRPDQNYRLYDADGDLYDAWM